MSHSRDAVERHLDGLLRQVHKAMVHKTKPLLYLHPGDESPWQGSKLPQVHAVIRGHPQDAALAAEVYDSRSHARSLHEVPVAFVAEPDLSIPELKWPGHPGKFSSACCMSAGTQHFGSEQQAKGFLKNVAQGLQEHGLFFGVIESGKAVLLHLNGRDHRNTAALSVERQWPGSFTDYKSFGSRYTLELGGGSAGGEPHHARNLCFLGAFTQLAEMYGLFPDRRFDWDAVGPFFSQTSVDNKYRAFRTLCTDLSKSHPDYESVQTGATLFTAFVFRKGAASAEMAARQGTAIARRAGGGAQVTLSTRGETQLSQPRKLKTVLAMFEWLNVDVLRRLLPQGQWRFVKIEEALRYGYVDVIVLDGKFMYDKRLYNLKSHMKGRLEAEVLANKIELHELMERVAPGIVCETHVISADRVGGALKIMDGQPWIWRPEGGWSGEGIKVLTSQAELRQAQQQLAPKSSRQRDSVKRAVVSRYILDPMLLPDGRKIHVRFYFYVVVDADGKRRAAISREGRIGTSRSRYVRGDYGNMDVHDTHLLTSDTEDFNFPRDFPRDADAASAVFDQAAWLLSVVAEHALPRVKSYEESKGGFEILGADFMVDLSGRVWLIEINHKPGHRRVSNSQEERDWLHGLVLRGVTEFVLEQPHSSGQEPAVMQVWPRTATMRTPGVFAHGAHSVRRAEASTHTSSGHSAPRRAATAPTLPVRAASKTFLPLLEQLPKDKLQTALGPGWAEVTKAQAIQAGWVDLLMMDGFKQFDRSLWSLHCSVKSRIEAPAITNKVKLHRAMMKGAPHHVCESIVLNSTQVKNGEHIAFPASGGTWIWRPDAPSGGGAGIAIISSQQELDRQRHLCAREFPMKEAVLSRYIANPKLSIVAGAGYKFHVRVYYLVAAATNPAQNRAALLREGEMARAMQPYTTVNFADPTVHDTHLRKSIERWGHLRFPRDFPGGHAAADRAFEGMRQCLLDVTRLTVPDLVPYKESRHGFNLFGCDFMVDADDRVWLIEINATPGFAGKAKGDGTRRQDWISKVIFESVKNFALEEPLAERCEHLVALVLEQNRHGTPAQDLGGAFRRKGGAEGNGRGGAYSGSEGYESGSVPAAYRSQGDGARGRKRRHDDEGDAAVLAHGGPTEAAAGRSHAPAIVRTYLPLLEHLTGSILARCLGTRVWKQISLEDALAAKRVNLVVTDSTKQADDRLRTLRCDVVSSVHAPHLTDKVEVHRVLSEIGSRWIPKCVVIENTTVLHAYQADRDSTCIWRTGAPRDASVGTAIVTCPEDLQAEQQRSAQECPGKPALLSQYVMHPALLNGKKFHIRLYFIVVVTNSGDDIRAGVFREGEIACATEPYVERDFGNAAVHKTDLKSSLRRFGTLQFPRDFPEGIATPTIIFDKMKACLQDVIKDVCTIEPRPFAHSRAAYNIYGCDFIVDRSENVWMLGVKSMPAFGDAEPDKGRARQDWLSALFFDSLCNFVFKTGACDHIYPLTLKKKDLRRKLDVGDTDLGPATKKIHLERPKKTCIVLLGHLSTSILLEILSDDWTQVSANDAKAQGLLVDLIVMDGYYWFDKSTWGIQARVKSRLKIDAISNKARLHDALRQRSSKWIPECFILQGPMQLPPGVWMWRLDVRGGGGKGGGVIQSQSELDDRCRALRPGQKAILTRYIERPLLYSYGGNEYKMHLRMYFLVVARADMPHKNRAAVFKHGEIDLALEQYQCGSFHNMKIHDSRREGSIKAVGRGCVIPFPERFPGGAKAASDVFRQVVCCLTDVAKLIDLQKLKPYGGVETGYALMGFDFLVDAEGQVYLIEGNASPGFPDGDTKTTARCSQHIFGGVNEFVLKEPNDGTELKFVVPLNIYGGSYSSRPRLAFRPASPAAGGRAPGRSPAARTQRGLA